MTLGFMKHSLLSTLIGLLVGSASVAALASITTISTRTEKDPAHHVTFVEMKKRVVLPGAPKTDANWMTDTRFAYDAGATSSIEDYAVIQWIRGCMYQSEYKGGKVVKTLPYSRIHFGNTVVFQHKQWELDSDNTDPVYSSDTEYGRFALLRWNTDPKSFDPETATYYAKAKPPHGSVFVTDLPGSAFLTQGTGVKNGIAQNSSLEFLTCLFHANDVPAVSTPSGAGLDQSRALWCVKWDHKFAWDFTTGQMTQPSQVDPVCQLQP